MNESDADASTYYKNILQRTVFVVVDELDGGGSRSSRIDRASGKGVGPGGGEGGVGGGGELAEVHGSSSVEDVAAVARFRRLGCSGSKARN